MEATAQSVEDYLIDGLSFKLKPGASYITNRRSVTYYPHGGNTYSPNGVKVIKLMLTGSDWLDPNSLRIVYDLVNADATTNHNLYPISGPWSFFRRVRVLCGGQIVEDIDYYNHVHEMFHILQPPEVRRNDDAEGFGNGLPSNNQLAILRETDSTAIPFQNNYQGIAPGSWSTVSLRFLSGIFNQDKFLPIRYCPITIELELVNQLTDPIINPWAQSPETSWRNGDKLSTTWTIQNVMLKADVVTLDNALDNEYAQHLLEGKTLPISYNTYVSQLLSLQNSSGNFTANITRSFTRLKSVFTTFQQSVKCPNTTTNPSPSSTFASDFRTDWNMFYHPMIASTNTTSGYVNYNPQQEMELQIQVGSKLYPEYPCKTVKEAFYQLRKCLGTHSGSWHGLDIDQSDYRSNNFIFAIDTEKMLAAGFTGLNTKAGDLMTIRCKYLGNDPTLTPDTLYVVLHSDQILNIRDTGVEVLE